MEGRFDELLLGLAKQHTDGVPGVRIRIIVVFDKYNVKIVFNFSC